MAAECEVDIVTVRPSLQNRRGLRQRSGIRQSGMIQADNVTGMQDDSSLAIV